MTSLPRTTRRRRACFVLAAGRSHANGSLRGEEPLGTSQPAAIARDRQPRRGVATVELAFCLPLLLLLVLGSIETCNVVFQKQTMTAAAYEAARTALRQDATSAQARAFAEQVLQARNVRTFTLTFSPTEVSNLPRGTPITVQISSPADQNTVMPHNGWYRSRNLQVSVRAVKE